MDNERIKKLIRDIVIGFAIYFAIQLIYPIILEDLTNQADERKKRNSLYLSQE